MELLSPLANLLIIYNNPSLYFRRSLLVIYGEPRYHWEHCILREDITSRRVCIAYREFTPPYLKNGPDQVIGDAIREKAALFWDHQAKYQG